MTVYPRSSAKPILDSNNKAARLEFLEIDMTTQHLSGKVALIQGGSRGIGAAIVKRLAAEGATVAFTYVSSTAKAEELQNSITSAGGNALAIKAEIGRAHV